jgi:hypothetical protein
MAIALAAAFYWSYKKIKIQQNGEYVEVEYYKWLASEIK